MNTPAPLQIRPIAETDLADIARLEAQLQTFPWTALQFYQSWSDGHRGIVATSEHQILGFAITSMVLDEASLLTLGVAPQWQRQGIAKRLIQCLIEHLGEQGAATLILEVRKSNKAARALYRGLGFIEVGSRRGYYRAEDGREDAVLMTFVLDEGGR